MSSSDRSNRPHTGMAGIFPEDALGPKGTPLSVDGDRAGCPADFHSWDCLLKWAVAQEGDVIVEEGR